MTHIQGPVVVVSDDETFEIVIQQAGPAGAIAAPVSDGIDVELDGGNIGQPSVVRVWHEGSLTNAHQQSLQALFGPAADAIISSFGDDRPRRIGNRQRLSSRPEGASDELVAYVSSHDALQRAETPLSTRALLELQLLVAAHSGGLTSTPALQLPATQPAPSYDALQAAIIQNGTYARNQISELLNDAALLGLIDVQAAAELLGLLHSRPTRLDHAEESDVAYASEPVASSFIDALVLPSLNMLQPLYSQSATNRSRLAHTPLVTIDTSGHLSQLTTASWLDHSNIEVRIHQGARHAGTTWWARARRDHDGGVVAAAPFVAKDEDLVTMLLVAPLDHCIIDVVSDVAARVLSTPVGALNRAYEAGRRAGRLERLERFSEAADAWRECATWHATASDSLRQKMALAQGNLSRLQTSPSLSDRLLSPPI